MSDKTQERIFHATGKQELSIIGNDNSIMEYAYALIYLISMGGAVGACFGVVATALVYSELAMWAAVLVGAATFLLTTAITTATLLWGIVFLIRANHQQPRDDNGRFMRPVPVFHNGRHVFDLFSAVKRKIGRG